MPLNGPGKKALVENVSIRLSVEPMQDLKDEEEARTGVPENERTSHLVLPRAMSRRGVSGPPVARRGHPRNWQKNLRKFSQTTSTLKKVRTKVSHENWRKTAHVLVKGSEKLLATSKKTLIASKNAPNVATMISSDVRVSKLMSITRLRCTYLYKKLMNSRPPSLLQVLARRFPCGKEKEKAETMSPRHQKQIRMNILLKKQGRSP